MTYPVTIVLDRYGGVYSGGKWIAWALYPEDVPHEPGEDDSTALAFWHNERKHPCGRGVTPDAALANIRAAPLNPTDCAVEWGAP
jgi:hypothetical protein